MADILPDQNGAVNGGDVGQKFILVVDVGTTTLRCHIYNKAAQIIAQAEQQTQLLYPEPGAVEVDPDDLWAKLVAVVKKALHSGGLGASDIACLGVTTFRNSFITWDRETGKPFHHINMWQDKRTKDQVKSWNNSFSLAAIKKCSGLLHAITGSQKFKASYALKFMTQMIPLRLRWAIDNIPLLKSRLAEKQVMFGTVDTWLLWKLTGERLWIAERAAASTTVLYDPYQNMWSSTMLGFIGLPMHILPEIKDTSGELGVTDSSIFGAPIPITALVPDQQASLFGHCCFNPGDAKLTMGTGSFLDVNIGAKPLASITGIYPAVAWDINSQITFMAEASTLTVGTCVDWLKNLGIVDDVAETSDLANSVPDTQGCYFVPAFWGLSAPINDDTAGSLFIGITPAVNRAHMIRAVLESIAFVIKLQYETMVAECGVQISHIRVDGGVANNDFLLQCLADIIRKPIHRPQMINMTSRGTAFLAGIGARIWTSLDELKMLSLSETVFQPRDNWSKYKGVIAEWERAVRRSKGWTKE